MSRSQDAMSPWAITTIWRCSERGKSPLPSTGRMPWLRFRIVVPTEEPRMFSQTAVGPTGKARQSVRTLSECRRIKLPAPQRQRFSPSAPIPQRPILPRGPATMSPTPSTVTSLRLDVAVHGLDRAHFVVFEGCRVAWPTCSCSVHVPRTPIPAAQAGSGGPSPTNPEDCRVWDPCSQEATASRTQRPGGSPDCSGLSGRHWAASQHTFVRKASAPAGIMAAPGWRHKGPVRD